MENSSASTTSGRQARTRPLHVLLLNTRTSLSADVSVHLSLVRAFDRTRTRVWAATSTYETPGASARAELESIPELIVLPLDLGRPLAGRRGLSRGAALLHNMRGVVNLIRLAMLCRRAPIDVIHVTERPRDALFGVLLARLGRSACVIHAHTSYYRHDATRLGDWTLRRANAVVGVSCFTASTFVHDAGLPANRVFAVHNAVDSAAFEPGVPAAEQSALRARLGIPADAPLIGCVARLSRGKDQASLLEALVSVRHVVPGARLVLAGFTADCAPDGQGNYKDYLLRRSSELGLEGAVTFAGFLSRDEMPAFYATLDVLAHPAVEEPFGLAIVEAMSSMTPVVAADGGGIPEIIRDGIDGLLVPGKNPRALAAALTSILRDSALAERLAHAGRARVSETFIAERQAAEMWDIYRGVVARGGYRASRTQRRRAERSNEPHNWCGDDAPSAVTVRAAPRKTGTGL